jgi:hypothetical protein
MGEWTYCSILSQPQNYAEVGGQPYATAALSLGGEAPSSHWTGGRVGSAAGMDVVWRREKFGIRTPNSTFLSHFNAVLLH